MDYVKRKKVTMIDLLDLEKKLKEELNINFKFTYFYEETAEILVKKGDAVKLIIVNRLFQNIEQAYSEIKNYVESVYDHMIEFHDNGLLAMYYKEYDPEDRSSTPIMICENGNIMQAVYVDMYGRI